MGDLSKILDGTVEEVKAALAGKSHVDLHELRKQEVAGKNRSGVLAAIDAGLDGDSRKEAGATGGERAATANDSAEDNGIAQAETIDTSGAPQQIVPDVDMANPAVDADPRANTTAEQNRIDFNDPTREGHEVVADQLGIKNEPAA